MSTAAEPRPAELPLPGGRPGATVRLHPLLSGHHLGPRAWFLREERRFAWRKALGLGVSRSELIEVPIVAFCVEHPGAGAILIDTGFHPSVADTPRENLGLVSSRSFRDIEMRPEQAVAAQLRERGLDSAEVGVVVMTHLHTDHASAVSEFPGATFLVSSREWDAATSDGPLHGYLRRQFDHPFDWRTLDFDSPDSDAYATFGRSYDLFGDGSVRLVFTPGHTLGHLSVVLRLRARDALVAGDAIYNQVALRDGHLPYRMEDAHLFRRSLREIQLYARETSDALIIPGHDMGHWRTLDPLYK
ncbi:MAG: N-acyl homoserine lactonase family protein [Thermoleophilaceae bacterium]